ncbi:MAG: PilN domain-containing protein [Acidobacteria bacterium]|nr:PilN domain-containing protein [Acidobacteriota bacterium]
MSARTSIELHGDGFRLVEVELPLRRRTAGDVRVRAFLSEVFSPDDPALLTRELARHRQDRGLVPSAWVTVWGLRSVQQSLRLPPAKPTDLEALALREVRKEIAPLETATDPPSVSIAIGAEVQVGSHRRREVSLVAVAADEVRRRIQPVIDAGFVVEGVLTPALALAAVARADHEAAPEVPSAYVALSARSTCVAIIRDGVVLFAREMPWGHDGDWSAEGQESTRARLIAEIKRSILYFKQTFRATVEHVVLCGDMANIRALTAPLGTELNATVKTLDSLVGIDVSTVPEPADEFRSAVAGLRLAIATASDPRPGANLLPASIRTARAARTRTRRVTLATAASLVLMLAVYMLAQRSASAYAAQRQRVEAQLASLEPEAQRVDALRQAYTLATAREAAVSAFDSQGPRLARLLEALSGSAPDDIVLTAVTVTAEGMAWRVTVTGVAITEDAAAGQMAINRLIERASASPYLGTPEQPPSLRVVSGRGTSEGSAILASAIPPGMTGVEFVLNFRVMK